MSHSCPAYNQQLIFSKMHHQKKNTADQHTVQRTAQNKDKTQSSPNQSEHR